MKMITYKTYSWKTYKIPVNDFNEWAIEAIKFIWEKQWWEESQDKMFEEFYKNIIKLWNTKIF